MSGTGVGVEHAVIGMGPDSLIRLARTAFVHQHFAYQGAVVGKAVDPCKPGCEKCSLDPGSIISEQMCKQPVMPVDILATISEGHAATEYQALKSRLGLVGEWPFRKSGATEWEFWRLNADQSNLAPVIKNDSVAVDHRDHARRAAALQRIGHLRAGGFRSGDGTGKDQRQHNENTDCCHERSIAFDWDHGVMALGREDDHRSG